MKRSVTFSITNLKTVLPKEHEAKTNPDTSRKGFERFVGNASHSFDESSSRIYDKGCDQHAQFNTKIEGEN